MLRVRGGAPSMVVQRVWEPWTRVRGGCSRIQVSPGSQASLTTVDIGYVTLAEADSLVKLYVAPICAG